MYVNNVQRKSVLFKKERDYSETEINLSKKKADSAKLFYEKILNVLISYLLML